nr:unnamed protein product [Callosobruchus chinensis]
MHGKPQICSYSDDKSVKVWDIPTEKNIISFTGHKDYIRAGAVCPAVPDMILSGGYDNIVKMYDTRTENEVLSVDHGSPVESLLFMPSGGLFFSAGGTEIRILDAIAGGKLLGSISQHHKTITCLRLASDNKRLLSGSLDRHVKVYDISTFKSVHTFDFPNAVLSLELTHEKEKYDHHLRKFEYSKALDTGIVTICSKQKPTSDSICYARVDTQKGSPQGIQRKREKEPYANIAIFYTNVTDYRFTRVLVDAANIFIDTYEDDILTLPHEIGKLFIDLSQVLKQECELVDELAALQGRWLCCYLVKLLQMNRLETVRGTTYCQVRMLRKILF